MAHQPITNDTLMVDMIETPGNKNSQDQILIQDNSAVRTYKEDISSTDSNGSPNALKVTRFGKSIQVISSSNDSDNSCAAKKPT
jgi:hypothetical protein